VFVILASFPKFLRFACPKKANSNLTRLSRCFDCVSWITSQLPVSHSLAQRGFDQDMNVTDSPITQPALVT
jgi:hypothetical protein